LLVNVQCPGGCGDSRPCCCFAERIRARPFQLTD
jgi:hypothetical protein